MNEEEIKEQADDSTPEKIEYINFEHPSGLFKNIFKTLSVVNGEAKIFFTNNEIKTTLVDPVHVMMATIKIPKSAIEEYQVNEDISLGFDLDKLNGIFKGSNKNDRFKFLYDSNKDISKAFINIGIFDHKYTLIDKDQLAEPRTPTLGLPVIIKLNTKILLDFLVKADKVSNYIEIIATKDDLTFNATGDSDEVSITLNREQMALYQCDDTYRSPYSVDYLLSIVKPLKTLFSEIELNMANDNPLRIVGDNGYTVEVLLAPRIESE